MKNRILSLTLLAFVLLSITVKANELKNLVPVAAELKDFKITEKPEYYDRDNLWEYINGAAPAYLAYNFEEVVTFTIMNLKNQLEIVADIYDMGDSLNAFGIYSSERSAGSSGKEFGGGSFQSDYTLYFWQDRYYVKLMAYDLLPETAKTLSLMAQIISQKIPLKGKFPLIFSVFPKNGQLSGSERYTTRDVLGQEYFAKGYSVDYSVNQKEYKIFLIHGISTEQAKQNLQKYMTYISTIGKITSEQLNIGDQAFSAVDNFYGPILFARKGAYIIGILGMENQKTAQELIDKMFLRLLDVPGCNN